MATQTAREIMSRDVEVIKSSETVEEAAKRLARENIGAMPICDGERLTGMLTDRDIVVKVIAQGKSPSQTRASELQTGKPVYVQADASIDEAMQLMAQNKVRRLPVVEDGKLVGMLAQADVVKALPKERAGELIETISKD